jgi:Domain of unknown function (DUF1707)/Cell wall-active antibiotics response 4TMS YvqF
MEAERSEPVPLRISDAEREAVVARLNAATGEGRLTLTEFTERSGLAYAARTEAELVPLLADLPAVAAAAPAVRSAAPVRQVTPVGAVKRSGRWRIDRDTEIGTVLGAIKLDLTHAQVAASEVELRVRAVLGSVKVWVPRGVRVEVTGTSALGSRQVEEDWQPDSLAAPLLRLHIDTKVGSVKVYRT